MIIQVNIQSDLSIGFRGQDFQRINMHHYKKNNCTIGGLIYLCSTFVLAILKEGH